MTDAYNPATRPCAKGVTKGCAAIQAGILGHWTKATNVGTFICRPTADGVPSVHGNGRAGDIGCTGQLGYEIALWLVANHTELGVQLVIWNHHIWNVSRADEGWRPYGCDEPGSPKDHHTTHIHWECNVDAATRVTPAIVKAVLPSPPAPPETQLEPEDDMPRIVQSGGGVFAVGHTNDVFTDVNGVTRTGPWRRTFKNPSQLEQHIGGGAYVTKPNGTPAGEAFKVPIPHSVFETVYGDLGPVQP